jgi:hypothetical protein
VNGAAAEPPLTPILIDGSGRDGTTLLMQLLGTAAEIAFDRVHPYEQRYFSYLLHWSRLPTRDGWDEATWNLDSIAHSELLQDVGVAGPLPWHDRSLLEGGGEPPFWREVFDAAWAAFSARARHAVRARLGDPSQPVVYYAQKNADSWALEFDRLPDLRLIRILRDPRDVWVSSVAFHRRRAAEGGAFLPIGPEDPVESALDRFIEDQRKRLGWLLEMNADRGADSPLVRYDRLLSDLGGEAERLGEWLGVRLDADAVLLRRDSVGDHITSADVELSAGRWRRDLAPELAARFWRVMGEELDQLGYEP